MRASCYQCNRIAPSQAKHPQTEPHVPKTPFEAVCSSYLLTYLLYLFIVFIEFDPTQDRQIAQGNLPESAKLFKSGPHIIILVWF